ncbi:MAG: 4Fe-4S binding protein [Mogibacterium sp.]|nr:4Fe-4S binding protein [Mogibacterium sp.]
MAHIEVAKERCKACELCTTACPFGLLRLSDDYNSAGDHYIVQDNPEKCIGCKLCAIQCPDTVIEVYK